jgi:regulator of protease activity HflC (stomatin/prohibitin superfamily)
MELGEDEAGLRYENDLLEEILPPGSRRVYWKGLVRRRLDKVDLRQGYALAPALAARLLQPNLRGRALGGMNGLLVAQVPAYYVGVLRVDGRIERLMSPGVEVFWRFNREIQVEMVDTRLQNMEVSGQEILSRDKVSLRLNLAATWRYTDVLLAFAKLAKPAEHLYRELQFGLREAVGTRSLDELLENKQVIDEVVSAYVKRKLDGFGIEMNGVGVKDIVLPGEMKTILAKVVEADKAAQANVIRRREETAATRSLLNTAKVMEDNPVALRLKELETLERVAERIDRISVFGGLDQVLNGLVTIKGA